MAERSIGTVIKRIRHPEDENKRDRVRKKEDVLYLIVRGCRGRVLCSSLPRASDGPMYSRHQYMKYSCVNGSVSAGSAVRWTPSASTRCEVDVLASRLHTKGKGEGVRT